MTIQNSRRSSGPSATDRHSRLTGPEATVATGAPFIAVYSRRMKWQHVLAALVFCHFAGGSVLAAAQPDSSIERLCRKDKAAGGPTVVETRLAAVPALVRVPPTVSQPPILLWHGFGPPASERTLMEALPLDEVPAIKVYLELPQFGARAAPGGREGMARRQAEDLGRLVFEPVVVGAAQELPSVIAALQELQ